MLDQYELNWEAWHENHDAAEYVAYGDLDDDTRPFGEQQEDGTWEADLDTPYLARCCGQDRPVHKRGLSVQVTPAGGMDFVTIRDYVAVVHLWMMTLREDIIGAKIVAGGRCHMAPAEARSMNWMISVRTAPWHEIFTYKFWLSDHTRGELRDDAATRSLMREVARVRAEKQQQQ
ncbi:hypothetical protein VHEMI08547 [[Torrubiella] hemipterigena]|uniref:Uncharacterized protein n=1 Tax=[Torrubiella] hemipterigena TaxID=1531966 RepID=A0A0A1TNC9_9HYPO|nr:hypothetical protein VHEMI08547 [[Torrubiella] hemipterigena]